MNPITLRCPAHPRAFQFALAAASPLSVLDPQILAFQWVPVAAHGFGGVLHRNGVATARVLSERNGLHVVGVNAATVLAQMVDGEARRDRRRKELVRPPVCEDGTARIRSECPVPAFVDAARPLPTVARERRLLDKPRQGAAVSEFHESSGIAMPVPARIMPSAPRALARCSVASFYRAGLTGSLTVHLGLILRGVMRAAVPAVRPLSIVRVPRGGGR